MRLISFNIQFRRRETSALLHERCGRLAAFIRSLDPDVLALQEVSPEAWGVLSTELDFITTEYMPRQDGDSLGEGVPVCTLTPSVPVTAQRSFWLSDTPDEPSMLSGAVHPRVCSAVRLHHKDQSSWLFNVHLDHRRPGVRKRSLEILHAAMTAWTNEQDEVLICGDFNTPGHHPSLRRFTGGSPKFTDATVAYPGMETRPTYLGWGHFRWAKARIDLVLHSPGLQVDGYQALDPVWEGQWISDHRAVVVDL